MCIPSTSGCCVLLWLLPSADWQIDVAPGCHWDAIKWSDAVSLGGPHENQVKTAVTNRCHENQVKTAVTNRCHENQVKTAVIDKSQNA